MLRACAGGVWDLCWARAVVPGVLGCRWPIALDEAGRELGGVQLEFERWAGENLTFGFADPGAASDAEDDTDEAEFGCPPTRLRPYPPAASKTAAATGASTRSATSRKPRFLASCSYASCAL